MLKKIITALSVMLFAVLLGTVSYANSDGPKITSPSLYSEYKAAAPVTVRWTKPPSDHDVVDHYVIAVRGFQKNENVTKATAGSVIVNLTLQSTELTTTISGSTLKYYYENSKYRKYRISVCAVTVEDKKRWSDHVYFYSSAHNTPADEPVSFHIYNGFAQESKDQIYYACQLWNNTLNIGREIANTYPYSKGTDLKGYDIEDGINVVTIEYNSSGALMTTHHRDSPTTHKAIQIDIVVNKAYEWSSTPQSEKYYFSRSMVHEMGHVVGLIDKYDSWAEEWTMYGYSVKGESKRTTLENQDILNAKSLYK